MDKQKLLEKIAALKRRIKDLAFKSELSEDEAKELQAGLSDAETLETQLEAIEKTEADEAEAQAAAEADLKAKIAEATAEKDAELEELRKKVGKSPQPPAPSTGAPSDGSPRISVGTRYDHLDTMQLAIGYQSMKAFGRQPSEQLRRVLAVRAAKMGEQEDELYVKNGQAVKVPAIDPNYLKPSRLNANEEREDGGDPVSVDGVKSFMRLAATKANEVVHSTLANSGDEWVPTLMNAQLWRTVRLNAAVLALFDQFDMPSQPYDMPAESTDPVVYKVAETTAETSLVIDAGPYTDSKPGTAKITFSAGKLGAISYWSDEQEEDGIIAPEPQFRDQYGLKIAHSIDEVLISGDETTGTPNISYEGSAIDAASRFLIVDGLRHEALVTTTADSRDAGALTIDDFGATQALMGVGGKFGVNPSDLVWLMDPGVWHKAKMLGEVLTVDKFGSMATVLNGQLAALFGAPLVISEDYSLTDATGRIDETAGDNVKGSFMCVNKRGVLVGWRRRPRIRVERVPFADAVYIVGSARFDIRYKEAGMVGLSYNVTI